jgi:hypothetical protein
MDERSFEKLENYLLSIPSIVGPIGKGSDDSSWWVKFGIDIESSIAWHTVQELGHVLNYLSLDERLPTSFQPVSPPPYMNGGPDEYLSWVIECSDLDFRPGTVAEWLEGRLPRPVDDMNHWLVDSS